MVHGDRRTYLTALITLDEAEIRDFAAREKIPDGPPETLAAHPRIRALVEGHVAAVNARPRPLRDDPALRDPPPRFHGGGGRD